MRKLYLSIILILIVTGIAIAQGNRRLTIEDALAIKAVGAPQFSPDAKWVVYTVSDWDKENNRRVSHIYLAAADASRSIRLTNGEKGESAPQWSPDGGRIAFLADRDKGNQIWVINVMGGEAERLTSEENGIAGFQWSPDGKRLAFITRDTPKDKAEREKKKKDKFDTIVVEQGPLVYSHIWALTIDSKEKKRITEGPFSASNPQWSPDGRWIAYVKSMDGTGESSYFELSPDRNTDIYLVSADGGAPRQLTTNPGSDSGPQWSPDGKWVAYSANADSKSWAAKTDVLIIASEGGTPRNLTPDFFESAGGPNWSPDGKVIYFSTGVGVYTHINSVPVSGGAVTPITKGNRSFAGLDISKDGSKFACLIGDSSAPADIYVGLLSNLEEGKKITTINPQLKDFAIAKTTVLKWKGPDNFDIEGVIVVPVNYERGKRYPLILQIHGGPYGRFDAGFNSRAQIFAANGYAVLMPNPRGSTGYGNKFTNANIGDWGGKDFKDIMAGVDAAVAQGVADPDRCVVMGGSYGGFMTFWTITQTDRFKAAIGHAGISDWYSFHGQSDIPGLMEYGFVGYPWNATENYRKWSPMTFVDRVKTPIMITHGEQDRRVPIAQAEEYYRALKRRGLNVVFLRYPREGHGITEPNHQIDLVRRQLEWFDSHLGIKREKPTEGKPTPAPAGNK